MGIADNTVIIFTSDHGSHFRTRNSEYKRSCHEGSIRVPMVAFGPGFSGGKVVQDLVNLLDVPPTLLTCGGISKPVTMQGRPLQELVQGIAKNWPDEVFVQITENQVGRAIRTKRWKYSVVSKPGTGMETGSSNCYIEDFLYDLENDYHERNNLIRNPEYAQVRKELSIILKKRMLNAGEDIPEIIPL